MAGKACVRGKGIPAVIMNKVILLGRLTKDPEVRYSNGENQTAFARYTLAVNRRYRREGNDQEADFISCVAFGKSAEFAERYLHKGTKIVVTGRIQTGSYTNRDNQKVYTTDVVVEEQEFAESKSASNSSGAAVQNGASSGYYPPAGAPQAMPSGRPPMPAPGQPMPAPTGIPFTQGNTSLDDAFMNIPDGIDEELPFN